MSLTNVMLHLSLLNPVFSVLADSQKRPYFDEGAKLSEAQTLEVRAMKRTSKTLQLHSPETLLGWSVSTIGCTGCHIICQITALTTNVPIK